MFSTKEFVEASRNFVCIRIETYENKENEERIRKLLNGKFANTSFCMFDPPGRRRLTRTGRSPGQVMGRRTGGGNEGIIKEMYDAASRYRKQGSDRDALLQDFLSFSQALNIASADQRLLVFVNADENAVKSVSPTLKKLFTDDEIIGRFHLDFAGKEDAKWSKAVKGSNSKNGINIIRAGKFGLEGSIMSQLSIDATFDEIKTTLLAENRKFNSTEERKDYADHVMEGKRAGVKSESAIPWGEDLDGDGKIDERTRGKGGQRGGAKGGQRGGAKGGQRGAQGGQRGQGQRGGGQQRQGQRDGRGG